MSRALTAAHDFQRKTPAGLVLRIRTLLLCTADAFRALCDGIRDGVNSYRKYEQLRAQGAAHSDALLDVQAESDHTKRASKRLWK